MQTCFEVLTDSHWEIIKEIVSEQRKRNRSDPKELKGEGRRIGLK